MLYRVKNNEPIDLKDHPYSTCGDCPVKHRCRRFTGEAELPSDYYFNPECSGYLMVTKALELSRLPKEFYGLRKEDYKFDTENARFEPTLKKMFSQSADMVNSGSNVAFIHPNKGTGKTHTACTVLNEYIYSTCMTPMFDYENPIGLYIKYGKWSNDLRNMYTLNDEDFNLRALRTMKIMKEVPLLVIDDIGSGRITNYIRDLTYDLIDYRKENKLSTIFTTNLTRKQLSHPDCLGDIIDSRLFYNTIVYEMGGTDRRGETTLYI